MKSLLLSIVILLLALGKGTSNEYYYYSQGDTWPLEVDSSRLLV